MPRKAKKALAAESGRVKKSAWIRSQPASLAAREVVEKARGEGIVLSLAQVYTARSTAKQRPTVGSRAKPNGSHRGPGRPKKAALPESHAVSGDLRRQFILLAVRLGTDEAQRLLDRVIDVQTGN